MKRITRVVIPAALLLFVAFGCAKEKKQTVAANDAIKTESECTDYDVTLLSHGFQNGKTTYVWSIVNPIPGNGTNCTLQDLSHWGLLPDPCSDTPYPGLFFFQQDVVSAAYSKDGGATWVSLGKPAIKTDKSQNCSGNYKFLKFDAGTNGSAATQYKLVLNGQWSVRGNVAFFKAGQRCWSQWVEGGIGCKP